MRTSLKASTTATATSFKAATTATATALITSCVYHTCVCTSLCVRVCVRVCVCMCVYVRVLRPCALLDMNLYFNFRPIPLQTNSRPCVDLHVLVMFLYNHSSKH